MKALSVLIITLLLASCYARGQVVDSACHITSLPSVYFEGQSTKLTKNAMLLLDSIAGLLEANPMCIVSASMWSVWNCRPNDTSMLGWNRTLAVVDYLIKKKKMAENRLQWAASGIDSSRKVALTPLSITEKIQGVIAASHP